MLPAVVGVYGGGRMGAGIAHAFLVSGAQVVVVEGDESLADAARGAASAASDAVRNGLDDIGGGDGPVDILHLKGRP